MPLPRSAAGGCLVLVLLVCFGSILAAAQDVQMPPSLPAPEGAAVSLPAIVVSASPTLPIPPFDIETQPTGQTVTTIPDTQFQNQPAFSIGDILRQSPGISIKQGNGPRDVGISIRGSNARNGFGIRNIQVFEDGFPVTQPDGLSRTDLTDPHAYSAIDVFRGPSSAMFGNYATGGAINFHTRPGSAIRGADIGSDTGSFGYFNEYAQIGDVGVSYEYSLFASHVRGNGFEPNSSFTTTTGNVLASYSPTSNDKFTAKVIDNYLGTALPIRLSFNQYNTNPFQMGCVTATSRSGCASVSLFANGVSPPAVQQTATQAGLGRSDQRTILGLRWDHSIDVDTVWQTQYVYDNKDISQPTGATSAVGDQPASNLMTGITQRGSLLGLPATHFAQAFFDYVHLANDTYNLAPGGGGRLGALTSYFTGHQSEVGGRLREEVRFAPLWTAVAAVGVERTVLDAVNTINTFATPTSQPVGTLTPVLRYYVNVAPEVDLLFRPDDQWQFRARAATGYGTPQASNLFVTPQGVPGNNVQLQTQTNLGFDLGADWNVLDTLSLSVTGFYELFHNEFVTQSPGAGLQNFTFNAPASVHRGVEVGAIWYPAPGWRAAVAYLRDDQFYTDYVEQLSAGTRTNFFNRAGNRIPGIEPNNMYFRLSYDQPDGPLAGFGVFAESYWRDSYYIDNANLVRIPGYALVNLNFHYDLADTERPWRNIRVFFEIQNLFGVTYVASANNVSDSINATSGQQNPASVVANAGGSIYAGAPRTFIGGVRIRF